MSVFESLDLRLQKVADDLNAKLTKNRDGASEINGFEERRIDWVENNLEDLITLATERLNAITLDDVL